MKLIRQNKVYGLVLCMACSPALWAASTTTKGLDQNQPVTLEADKATFNDKTGITTYTGNVIIQQGSLKINAESLVVNLNPDRSILDVKAQGKPVRFEQQLPTYKTKSVGEAQNLVYNAKQSVIVLTGKAKLLHNGASFTGETLRYSMAVGDIVAEGKGQGRVKLVIPPNMNRVDQPARLRVQ